MDKLILSPEETINLLGTKEEFEEELGEQFDENNGD